VNLTPRQKRDMATNGRRFFERTGDKLVISPVLYNYMEEQGCIMTHYIKNKELPTDAISKPYLAHTVSGTE